MIVSTSEGENMRQYTVFVLIDAENDEEALEYAKGIVFPSEPIDWTVEECE